MESPLRNTWEIFTGRFEKILILMLFTTLPLLVVHSLATNYIYAITPNLNPSYSFGDIYYALITILLFLYAQVPYIRFIYNEHNDVENSLRDAIFQFAANGFTVFLFATIISILSTLGFALFILPGFIILTLTLPIPYISIFDKKSVWKSFREGARIGKKKFFKIFILIFFTGLLELVTGLIFTIQLFNITNSFAAQMVTQMVINLIYFPFVVMLLASYMIKWREEQIVLETYKEIDVA
jgi:hypothetical protein